MQRLCDFEMNVRKSTGLEGVAKEERPRFGARLSVNLAQGGRGGSRSMGPVGGPITWRLFLCFSIYIPGTLGRLTLADDAVSLPLNRPTITTMAVTDDTTTALGSRFLWSALSGVAGYFLRF